MLETKSYYSCTLNHTQTPEHGDQRQLSMLIHPNQHANQP